MTNVYTLYYITVVKIKELVMKDKTDKILTVRCTDKQKKIIQKLLSDISKKTSENQSNILIRSLSITKNLEGGNRIDY